MPGREKRVQWRADEIIMSREKKIGKIDLKALAFTVSVHEL